MKLKAMLQQLLAIFSALALAGGPAMAQTAVQLTRIGGAGAVRGSVSAIAPSATVGREIQSGKPIYLNDHVTTKADSRLQVMLLDETVFTVGPDSDMVLDEFVYDPNSSAGKVTARLTKGVFRFVSGKVARQGPDRMQINTPTGTIGIRGTSGVIIVTPEGVIIVLTGAGPNNTAGAPGGHIHVQNKFGSVEIIKVGFGTTMTINGVPSTPANMEKILAQYGVILNPKGHANVAPASGAGGNGRVGAVQQTGGDVLIALGGLQNTNSFNQQLNQNSLILVQAQQDSASGGFTANGISSWDFITQQLTSGTGSYTSSPIAYSCSGNGGACGSGTGSVSFNLDITFGTQQVSGSVFVTSTGGGTFSSDSTGVTYSYTGLHGPAVIPINSGGSNGSTFTGAIELLNTNGKPATMALMGLGYSGNSSASGMVIGGVASGPRN